MGGADQADALLQCHGFGQQRPHLGKLLLTVQLQEARQQVLLAGEVGVDGALREPRLLGHGVEGHGMVATTGEQQRGGLEQE